MKSQPRYSQEVRERAVRMVLGARSGYPSQWAAICSIASKFDCTPETLRRWIRQTERDSGVREGISTDERRATTDDRRARARESA